MFEPLPSSWKTERLHMEDLTAELVLQVQQLYESSQYLGEWDGNIERKPDYIMKCLAEGELPPNGKKENYRMQTIKRLEDGRIVGYFTIYHGFPNDDITYIAFMYIDRSCQRQGYAAEVIKGLTSELTRLNYRAIRLNVALKNWPGIRFWLHSGFTTITTIHGDVECSEHTFANIELERVIR
ncbi:hypothetical protein PAECIP111893_02778 [Paenibacillus plantiphilus]|uniref:N-acetyltransferase domain-containing protein n=1 Tax=Paenibacillus plantiphilus TaxID=2905650 RepID=A0ABM9C965_9BACL|nr:GNAT family N-acetyltransferase [Paenibacillus plantiphilus]CAH1207777.1 hypothetical protein PAECIP111893_02778 [Paenibacillus plantiphilus]